MRETSECPPHVEEMLTLMENIASSAYSPKKRTSHNCLFFGTSHVILQVERLKCWRTLAGLEQVERLLYHKNTND